MPHSRNAVIPLAIVLLVCQGMALGLPPREELERLKRELPPVKEFDAWLEKFGYLPPDLDALPAVPYPQDPLLVMADGKPRRVTPDEWPAQREQLRKLTADWLLGQAPPPPDNLRAVIEEKKDELAHQAWRVRLEFGPDHQAHLRCWLWVPLRPKRTPLPVFLVDNFRYTSFARAAFDAGDFAICIYDACDPAYAALKAPYEPAGDPKSLPDGSEQFADLFGKEYDWSEFLRRGWAASRAADWLRTLDFIDKDKLFIGGHSRSAKQSLACAAFDQRIAGVIASSPGSGGSLAYRYCDQYYWGESAELLTRNFPLWVSPKVRFFSGRENKLPADFHFVYALIAPRPVLMSTRLNDSVENTFAVERTFDLARPVYELLDKPNNLVVRYHPGPHKPDEATEAAHSRFLTLAAAGEDLSKAFPYRPMHPWDYERWVTQGTKKTKEMSPVPPMPSRADELPAWRQEVRQHINWLLGAGPEYQPAKVEFTPGPSRDRTRVRFGPGLTGDIFRAGPATRPAAPAAKHPAVLFLAPLQTSQGYNPSGYRYGEAPHLRFARAGFVTLAFDPIAANDRQQERRGFYDQHPDWSLMGKMVFDARHAIDALLACDDVDPHRIYVVGYAMGGMTTTFLTALDDRIAGAAIVAGFTPFRSDIDASATGGLRRWSHLYGWLPRLGPYAGGREAQVPVDFPEILAAAAPRRILVVAPKQDWHATHAEVAKSVETARNAFQLLGQPENLSLESPDCWLRFDDPMQARVIQWLGP